MASAGSWPNRSRVGSATPSPKAKASRVPSEGTNARRLAAASETAERITAWSRSLAMRMANSVLHWEMMVASSSAGLCVTRPRNTPYLRPSLAMREMALRVGPKPIDLVARRVAVGLLAHEQQLHGAVAPQAEVEGHAPEHGHHRVDHLRGEAGELHDGHRPAVGRQPEQLAQHLHHGVAADVGVVEHEGVARVLARRLDARDEPAVLGGDRAVLELAHALVDQVDQVRQPVGHGRVDGEQGAVRNRSSSASGPRRRAHRQTGPWPAG